MPQALHILHLAGLMLGFAGALGGMLTLGHARPAQKQKGGALRGVGPVFAHIATFGLIILWPTGFALLVTGKGFDPANAMFWMKMIFAGLLTFATFSVEMIHARARRGDKQVARMLPSLGPLATLSYLAVTVFSVLAAS